MGPLLCGALQHCKPPAEGRWRCSVCGLRSAGGHDPMRSTYTPPDHARSGISYRVQFPRRRFHELHQDSCLAPACRLALHHHLGVADHVAVGASLPEVAAREGRAVGPWRRARARIQDLVRSATAATPFFCDDWTTSITNLGKLLIGTRSI